MDGVPFKVIETTLVQEHEFQPCERRTARGIPQPVRFALSNIPAIRLTAEGIQKILARDFESREAE